MSRPFGERFGYACRLQPRSRQRRGTGARHRRPPPVFGPTAVINIEFNNHNAKPPSGTLITTTIIICNDSYTNNETLFAQAKRCPSLRRELSERLADEHHQLPWSSSLPTNHAFHPDPEPTAAC